jgi:hypothetical protein
MSLKQAKKDNKLSPKYYGPYKVLQNIGTMAYKLELSKKVEKTGHYKKDCKSKKVEKTKGSDSTSST